MFRSYTRTHATPTRRLRRAQASLTGVRPLTWECCSPSNPGTPQNCLRRFCGEPHSGFPPPLRHSTCSPSRRRKLRRSSIARLLLFPFRIYIRRGPLGEFSSLTLEYCYPLPAGFVVLKREIEYTSRGECCSPSFPSGFPPPLGKSAVLLKCGICFSSFLIKFESRIEIIKRRTV